MLNTEPGTLLIEEESGSIIIIYDLDDSRSTVLSRLNNTLFVNYIYISRENIIQPYVLQHQYVKIIPYPLI